MLKINPKSRISSSEILKSEFFNDILDKNIVLPKIDKECKEFIFKKELEFKKVNKKDDTKLNKKEDIKFNKNKIKK